MPSLTIIVAHGEARVQGSHQFLALRVDSLAENSRDHHSSKQLPHRAEPERRRHIRLRGRPGDHQGNRPIQAARRERQAPVQGQTLLSPLTRSGRSGRGGQPVSQRAGGSASHDGEVHGELSSRPLLREQRTHHRAHPQSLSVHPNRCAYPHRGVDAVRASPTDHDHPEEQLPARGTADRRGAAPAHRLRRAVERR